jgi:sugar-specific transcriptional regulator TrmB
VGSISDDLVEQVRNTFQLNEYEARAYMALLRLGKAKPIEVARASGVPTGRIYDVLKTLYFNGLVVKENSQYRAVPPLEAAEEVARRIILEAETRAQSIRELGARLEGLIESGSSEENLRYLYGVEQSVAAAINAASRCTSSPTYFTVYKAGEKLDELWPLLASLLSRLRNPRILVVPDLKPKKMHVEALHKVGAEVREHECVIYDSMAACDTVLLGLPSKVYGVVTAYIKQPEFAQATIERLGEIWNRARIPEWYRATVE